MKEFSGVTDAAPSLPNVDEWRERLLAFSSVAAAAALLLSPFLFWLIAGTKPSIFVLPVLTGLVILVLPYAHTVSIETRSWVYCYGLIVIAIAIALNFGFAPVFVGTYNLLLLTAGLLLGKRAMVVITMLGVGGFVMAGIAINGGTFVIDTFGRDPGNLRNWVRVAVLFSLMSLAIVSVVRFATRTISDQYTRVSQELARATQLRKTAERAREKRLSRERELRGVQKLQAVAALSGGLAHLFNNALTVVQSALESLQRDASMSNRATVSERLGNAMAPALRATRDLMIFSRLEAPEARSIELAPMLKQFAETLGETVPDDVNLQIDATPGLSVVMSPEALKQLLLNLLLNAADAMSGPGKIRITVALFKEPNEPSLSRAVVVVEDDGTGMDDETLRRATDPFFSSRTEHSGLGLPVAHAIAAQAGGELRLESSEGVGARALVLLPLETPITSFDPASLWPTPGALHGNTSLGTFEDAPATISTWNDDPLPEPAWQDDVARRLGRIVAITIFALVLVVSVLVPHMRPFFLAFGPVSILLMAVAGWAPVPGKVARTCLIIGFWIIGTSVVLRAGFDNMAGMSITLIAVAWAGMLGGRWGGITAVALTGLTFLLFGFLRSGPVYFPPASNSDMNAAANWFRFAPQLALYSLALSTSVLSALTVVRRSMESELDALESVEEMREREAEEGARLLAIETRGTRSERASAAGQAAGTVAHDLLNAVQSLMGAVDVLALREGTDDQYTDLLAGLTHAAGYAEALTSQFDSISSTQNADEYRYPVCDVSAMSTTMAGLMERVLPDRIELNSDINAGLAIRISETDFRRLVFNLISNARDAIDETGTITMTLRSQADTVSLCVTDDGRGFDDAVKAKMFDPFFSTKESGRGTGLGLHSVNDVVRRTRGSIGVDSTPGKGSSFTVQWPAEVHESPAVLEATAKPLSGTGGGVVLLAEDEPLVREVMADALREAGFDVVEAVNGDEAKRRALLGVNYVAACVDGVMPGAPSIEVINCFQQVHPGRPVLLCSGYLPADLADRGLMKTGVTLLEKPFAPSRLQKELRLAIAQSDKADQ